MEAMQVYRLTRPSVPHAFRVVMPLVASDAPRRWVHVAYTCTFVKDGEAGEFTRETFDQMVANFEQQKNPMPLYLEHEVGPAYGWVHRLQRRGEDLWALVEFGEQAAEWVNKGQYRFCSFGIAPESESRSNGEPIGAEMYELSLTNLPFLDGQTPIQFTRNRGTPKMSTPKRPSARRVQKRFSAVEAAKEALDKLDGDASKEQVVAVVEAAADMDAAVEGAPESEMVADAEPVEAAGSPDDEQMSAAQDDDETMQDDPAAETELAAGAQVLGLLMEYWDTTEEGVIAILRDKRGEIEKLAGEVLDGPESEQAGFSREEGGEMKPDELNKILMHRVKQLTSENEGLRAKNEKLLKEDCEAWLAGRVARRIVANDETSKAYARKLFMQDRKMAEHVYPDEGAAAVPVGEFAPSSADGGQGKRSATALQFARLPSHVQDALRHHMGAKFDEDKAMAKLGKLGLNWSN